MTLGNVFISSTWAHHNRYSILWLQTIYTIENTLIAHSRMVYSFSQHTIYCFLNLKIECIKKNRVISNLKIIIITIGSPLSLNIFCLVIWCDSKDMVIYNIIHAHNKPLCTQDTGIYKFSEPWNWRAIKICPIILYYVNGNLNFSP